MTGPIEDLIRATLSDLAEEAPTVQDQLIPAERRARSRQRTTVTLGVAGVAAAVLLGAPIALAASRDDAPPPFAPGSTAIPSPTLPPSPSGPWLITPSDTPTPPPSPSGSWLFTPSGTPTPPPSPSGSWLFTPSGTAGGDRAVGWAAVQSPGPRH
ncbi:hypothetical protein K7640_21240 [Micromonospora sp. PLK6-60]|uniref:hypothetical protein n=1 Tax=Micromonospora sp. PLK6-60 TaxID=2873383 RepID=UPI001CA7222D|nr:hypothetical protein [Micromonospora sp. PLK6-60]MBY8874360.1 hypothetical protein [Micromonospora sp. PLK6-60]